MSDTASETKRKAIVVGAGMAGLTSALRLAELGLSVTLCDAGQVGGRTKSILIDGKDKVSVGGTWANFECDDLLGLASEVNCLPFAPDLTAEGDALPHMVKHPFTLMHMYYKGQKFSQEMLAGNPSEQAKKYDNMSVQKWLDGLNGFFFPTKSKQSVLIWLTQLENLPWDLTTFSALYACILVYERLHAPSNTGLFIPQTMRWQGGTGVLVDEIKKKLLSLGVTIKEDSPVELVNHGDDEVEIKFKDDDNSLKADYAVFAMSPPAVENNIKFEPDLLPEYHTLNKAMGQWSDPAYNIVLQFPSRFWVEDEGEKYKNYLPSPLKFDDPHKPGSKYSRCFGAVMDLTPKDSDKGYLRILVDPIRTRGLTDEEVMDGAFEYLEKCYDVIKLKENRQHCKLLVENWEERQPYLDVTYYWKPDGSYSECFKTLAKPYKRLFWAGAERSLSGVSWIEGAVTSGTNVARQIADHMGMDQKVKEKYFIEVKQKKEEALAAVQNHSSFNAELTVVKTVMEIIARNTFDPFYKSLGDKWADSVQATPPLERDDLKENPHPEHPKSVKIKKISGANLAPKNRDGKTSDPLVHIGWVKRDSKARFVKKGEKEFVWQSKFKKGSLSFSFPEDDENFSKEFPTLEVVKDRLLQIEVWDGYNWFDHEEWMGCIWVDVAHLTDAPSKVFKIESGPGKAKVSGTITIEYDLEWPDATPTTTTTTTTTTTATTTTAEAKTTQH